MCVKRFSFSFYSQDLRHARHCSYPASYALTHFSSHNKEVGVVLPSPFYAGGRQSLEVLKSCMHMQVTFLRAWGGWTWSPGFAQTSLCAKTERRFDSALASNRSQKHLRNICIAGAERGSLTPVATWRMTVGHSSCLYSSRESDDYPAWGTLGFGSP